MILRARIVLPVAQRAIENGAVVTSGNRIVSVGRWSDLKSPPTADVVDLGESILLPGLINAHCHLDYTHMAGKIAAPRGFADWIKAVVAHKSEWNHENYAQSWRDGARMLLRTGTTTVADVEAVPELIPDMWAATPLRVISFRELISLKSRFAVPEQIEKAVREWSALPETSSRAGLSPHAPYTTSPELLHLAGRAAREYHWRLTTHVSESEQEFEMFMYRHGALYDWLKSQRDMSDCGLGSPVSHLERCGYLSDNLLAAHVNYLWRDDAELLGRRQVSVVHCPGSHAYFRHLLFPRAELDAAGVNICLGTDSLASASKVRDRLPELNMFTEMQTLASKVPDLSPAQLLRMSTLNGALALGRKGGLGELSANAAADMISIPFAGSLTRVDEAAVHHSGDVSAVMIGGQWAIRPIAPAKL